MLAAEVPAAILAKMLGIHIKAAIQWQQLSNGDWTTYAADVSQRTTEATRGHSSSLRVPKSVIKAKSAPYLSHGKPERRSQLVNEDEHTIVASYGAEFRGIVQYYLLAGNVHRLARLQWVMETSMQKTLANKHRSTASTMARKYKTTIQTPDGPRMCFDARIDRTGRNHWSHGSVALRYDDNATRPSATASPSPGSSSTRS